MARKKLKLKKISKKGEKGKKGKSSNTNSSENILKNNIFDNKLNTLSKSFNKKNIKTILSISKDNTFISTVQRKLSISIAITVLSIIIIGFIINYLSDLQRCKCFNENNDSNYSNITYLIVIEALILIIEIIMLLFLIFIYSGLDKMKKGGYYNENQMLLYYLSFIITLSIYGFFIYYVIKLQQNVKDSCKCSVSPVRYLLYIQAFLMLLMLIGFVMNLSGK